MEPFAADPIAAHPTSRDVRSVAAMRNEPCYYLPHQVEGSFQNHQYNLAGGLDPTDTYTSYNNQPWSPQLEAQPPPSGGYSSMAQTENLGCYPNDYWPNHMMQNLNTHSPHVANGYSFPEATMSSTFSRSPAFSQNTNESPASSITYDSLMCQNGQTSSNLNSDTSLYFDFFNREPKHIARPSVASEGNMSAGQTDPFEALISIPPEQLSSGKSSPDNTPRMPHKHSLNMGDQQPIESKVSTEQSLKNLYKRVGEPEHAHDPVDCCCCDARVDGLLELARHIDEKRHSRDNFCPDKNCSYSIIGFNRRIALRRHICNSHLKEYNARRKLEQRSCSSHKNHEEESSEIQEFLDLVYICRVPECSRAFYRSDSLLRHQRCVH